MDGVINVENPMNQLPEHPELSCYLLPGHTQTSSIGRIKRLWREIFFQYPDALHELNRAMATECAEIALALAHLQIFSGCFQAAAHRNPCRPNMVS
jgi:hypothetical protein